MFELFAGLVPRRSKCKRTPDHLTWDIKGSLHDPETLYRQSRGYYHCVQTMEDCYQSKKSEDSYPCRLLKLHLLLKQSWRLVCLSSSKKDTKTYSKAVNGLVVNVLICEEGNPGPVLNQGVSLLLSKLILKDGE
ncbi:hypothetical protein Y1Q_0005258 [Alligator mississippiensis]|uniref:Uncharacterized protein n=1 Tax=Alligator mississippiensis TaxID=8496 RepID=A0A151MT64_ALLMI|nr:hypothetical protein Y1Q_0005258 [Alligator mississippiensis]